MKAILILFSLSLFFFTGMGRRQQLPASDFQAKVDRFLNTQTSDYALSNDRPDEAAQQHTLDTRANPNWKRKVTLKRKKAFVNNYKQKVYQRLYLSFYHYETNEQCTAALDSLMNCFGGDCSKLKRDVIGQSAKTIPCIYLINDKQIVACHLKCEHQNDLWTNFKLGLQTTFGNGAFGIIESGCGGPVNYRKF